jgi:hypothetical protein
VAAHLARKAHPPHFTIFALKPAAACLHAAVSVSQHSDSAVTISERRLMSALPPKPDIAERDWHVRFVPCVDGSELARRIFTSQVRSVQPCVRPLRAVDITAGHNALRGSGPGQKPAFKMQWHKWVVLIAGSTGSALRAVRPPTFHITPDVDAISFMPQVRQVLYSVRPWSSWPKPFWRSCWRVRWQQPWSAAALTML